MSHHCHESLHKKLHIRKEDREGEFWPIIKGSFGEGLEDRLESDPGFTVSSCLGEYL